MNSRHSNSNATLAEEPWSKPWPAEDLETVGYCPVCGEASRKLLHADLVDNAFRAAPGKWALWSCTRCHSAYLDPRPTPSTIHRAYANYYTHQSAAGKDDYAALSPFRKLRRRMVNGYTNWRFGTQALPSSVFGVIAAYALPGMKKVLDHQHRHLPRRAKGENHLLDVGCGAGSFLSLARSCGWTVVGLDPDPMAVASAARQGLTVHEGGIEYFDGQTELFDVITLNHVIEHVYEPCEVLKRCHTLLKPGGQLWLETPNIDSFGHEKFHENWRGLEPPRHLVIFNISSLAVALQHAGFKMIVTENRPSPLNSILRASEAIRRGAPIGDDIRLSIEHRLMVLVGRLMQVVRPNSREFHIVLALKKLSESARGNEEDFTADQK